MPLPCEEDPGRFGRESGRLSYWLAGLMCGALEPEEVSEELDRLVLEREEAVPAWLADAAWAAVQGVNPLIAALRTGLREQRLEPDAPLCPAVRRRVQKVIRDKWASGRWEMGRAIGSLSRLALLCGAWGPTGTAALREMADLDLLYDEALDGIWSMDQVIALFLRFIHEEEL